MQVLATHRTRNEDEVVAAHARDGRTRSGSRGPGASSTRRVFAILAALALGAGCGSNEIATEERSGGTVLTEVGWSAFAEQRYLDATESFEAAIAVDPLYADAENGLGWVNLLFGLYDIADVHFRKAISLGLPNQEAQAGHAFVAELQGNYDEALAASARVLTADPDFTLSRKEGIDFRDLRLSRARAFVSLGRFEDAMVEIDVIDPANNVNVASETFVDDLLEQIEFLGERLHDS
jgi:tetratricopeptide (TPR) repeat protein